MQKERVLFLPFLFSYLISVNVQYWLNETDEVRKPCFASHCRGKAFNLSPVSMIWSLYRRCSWRWRSSCVVGVYSEFLWWMCVLNFVEHFFVHQLTWSWIFFLCLVDMDYIDWFLKYQSSLAHPQLIPLGWGV